MQSIISKYDVGSIFWLPAKDQIPVEHLHETVRIEDGCFGHPVLILWANRAWTDVTILMITSLGGKDLEERHPQNARARSLHLPIFPSNSHPDNGICLFLQDDARLPRNSYVKTEPQRTIKSVLLRPTRHPIYKLTAQSYHELVRRIAFKPPTNDFSSDFQIIDSTLPVPVIRPEPIGPTTIYSEPLDTSHPVNIQQAYDSPDSTYHQNEFTPLIQPHQSANQSRSQDPEASDTLCGFMVIVILVFIVWELLRIFNG